MAVSVTFQGDDFAEVEGLISNYATQKLGMELCENHEPPEPPEPKKKARKKKAAKKKADAPDDPMDLFGDGEDDDDKPEASDSDSDETFGTTDPTIEDVRDALQNLVEAGKKKGPAMAQKVLSVYGDVSELAELAEDLYAKVIANAEKVVDKLTNG